MLHSVVRRQALSTLTRIVRAPPLSRCLRSASTTTFRIPKNCFSNRQQSLSQGARCTCVCPYSTDRGNKNDSSDPPNLTSSSGADFDEQMRNDPDVKAWLEGLKADFAAEKELDNVNKDVDSEEQVSSDSEMKSWIQNLEGDFNAEKELVDQDSSDSETSSSSDSDSDLESDSDSASDLDSSKETVEEQTSVSGLPEHSSSATPVDVDRELSRYDYEEYSLDYEEEEEEVEPEVQLPISLERGETGVFDIGDLVTLLTDENASDVCVMRIPPEFGYADHMVLVTGRSTRHLMAMAEFVLWVYKQRCTKVDPASVKIEGKQSKEWLAMDMGNVVLHMFMPDVREKYDLETLWTVGAEFDQKLREQEIMTDAFEWEDFMPENWNKSDSAAESADSAAESAEDPASQTQDSRTMESATGWHEIPPKEGTNKIRK